MNKRKILKILQKTICRRVKSCDSKIDWQKVEEVIGKNSGMPAEVGSN
jgi:hypothetical protein